MQRSLFEFCLFINISRVQFGSDFKEENNNENKKHSIEYGCINGFFVMGRRKCFVIKRRDAAKWVKSGFMMIVPIYAKVS
jgi:hypothetical protein